MTALELASRLNAKQVGDGWLARCPAHDDHHPSLSIGRGDDGRVLLHCQAGCAFGDVLSAAALTMADLHEDRKSDARTIVATYNYVDERDALLYQVCRFAPKDFRQRRPDGTGGWIWRLDDVRRVVFGLPLLKAQKVVFIVEGEKDVLALRKLGLVATTNAGGAGKWRAEYTEQLRTAGVGSVAIFPDNDNAGRAHAETVARSCHAAGIRAKVVMLPDLPQKADVSDYLASGRTCAELIALVKATSLYVPQPDNPASFEGSQVDDSQHARIDVRPVLVRLADVRPEPVTWLWPGRVAVGKLALLVGDPGLGKSWITLDIAARLSAGRTMPDGTVATAAADVILLSAEDGLADTIRPRLDALGADVARIHHLGALRAGEAERAVRLADTLAIERAIRETGARLLIIDPISAYLGSTDSHRDAEVRGLMAPLAAVAERTDVAILGVMHLAKNAQRPAIYRAVGSIAFAAAARIVLAVGRDVENDERRIVAPIKSNLSTAPAALAYKLADGRLVWEVNPVSDVDVDALLAGPALNREERREADAWLRELLANGPRQSRDIQGAAREAGIAWRTVERAKRRLRIDAELVGYGAAGRWYWRLPESATHLTETAACDVVAVSEPNLDESARSTCVNTETATLDTMAETAADSTADRLELDLSLCP